MGLALLLGACSGVVGNAPVFQMVGAHVPPQTPPAAGATTSSASTSSVSRSSSQADMPTVPAAPRDAVESRTLDDPGSTSTARANPAPTPARTQPAAPASNSNLRVSSFAPPAAETAKAAARTPAPMPAGGLATVMPGDTVQAISSRTGVSVRDLIELNGLEPPFKVVPGQTLALSADSAPLLAAPDRAQPVAVSVSGLKPPSRTGTRFSWPLRGDIIEDFGPRGAGQHNDGINIRAAKGAPVRAAEAGVVVYTGNELKGLGNLLLLRHDGGWVTAYAHADKISVKRGDIVKRGQVIAQAGSSGNVNTPQLHFEVRRGTKPVNPVDFLETQTARN